MSTKEKRSLLSKFLAVNSKPTKDTFPELPGLLVWFRFVLGAFYGTYLGLTPARDNAGANILLGFNFITFVPVVYCTTFLGADQASYDSQLVFSGVFSGLALMLLIWIYLFTLEHDTDAQLLASILSIAVGGGEETPIADTSSGGDEAGTVLPIVDSEF